MRPRTVLLVLIVLAGTVVLGPVPEHGNHVPGFVFSGAAQDPNNTTLPDPSSTQADPSAGIIVYARPETHYVEIDEFGSVRVPVIVRDHSLPATQFRSTPTYVACTPEAPANSTSWAGQREGYAIVPERGQDENTVTISTGSRPSPEFVEFHVVCEAVGGAITGRVVGDFNITARVREYSYMTVSPVALPPPVGPDQELRYPVAITNNGNQPRLFMGSVIAPDGWQINVPPSVLIGPGETKIVNITGLTPRDKPYYLSESHLLTITYAPEGFPGKAQSVYAPFQMNGAYVHPAIVPFTLLALILVTAFVWLAVLARRHIEEAILGKPVPPWRLPEEQEFLAKLEAEDPDEFYIVRYYLMVEEHRSALLWYNAYKRATKKDRKRETRWYKVKQKQEGKAERLENTTARVNNKFDRKVKFARWRERRKIKKLQRKHDRFLRKGQTRIDRKHRKKVRKIEKRHQKQVDKAYKKHDKKVRKETKKVLKLNKKRERNGEEALPMPDIAEPTFDEPELPEREVIQEVPLMEGRFAKRATKVHDRFDKKVDRIEARREKKKNRQQRAVDKKKGKILDKIPPEPKTELYDEDKFVPEDEAVVVADRNRFAELLRIPTLEERERARRRREIYQAERLRLKEAGDDEALARLEAEYAASRKDLDDEARARAISEREAKALAQAARKTKRRTVKARAKELAKEAEEEAEVASVAAAAPNKKPRAGRGVGRFRARTTKQAADDDAAPSAEPVTLDAPTEKADNKPSKGLRARFKRRANKDAASDSGDDGRAETRDASEQTKEKAAPATSSGAAGGDDKE